MADDQGTSREVGRASVVCKIPMGILAIHWPMAAGLTTHYLGWSWIAYALYLLQLAVWWSVYFRH